MSAADQCSLMSVFTAVAVVLLSLWSHWLLWSRCCCLPLLTRSPTLQLTAETRSELPRPGRTEPELPAPGGSPLPRNTEQQPAVTWQQLETQQPAPASVAPAGPGHVVMTAGRARADQKLAKLLQRRVASVSQISVSHSTTLLRPGLLWPVVPASRQLTAFCKLPGVASLPPRLPSSPLSLSSRRSQ